MATAAERWTAAGPIRSQLPWDEIQREEGLAAASAGEPAALGLWGFATATFTISSVLAGWFPATTLPYALPGALIFGGIVQFIAGMWSYRKGDTFNATAFGSFGAFNTAYALLLLFQRGGLIAGTGGQGVTGIMIACFSLIAFVLMVAALWKNAVLVAVLFFLALTYGLVAAGDIATGAHNLLSYGGWAGLISSVLAFYAGAALVINCVGQRVVLPLGGPILESAAPQPALIRRDAVAQ